MLQVSNLSVGYGQKNILQDINFSLYDDQILAVIGPSGSGKTTLINAITQLIPSDGEIQIDGENLNLKKHTVSLMPQNYGLLPWKSVRQNIVLANEIRQHKKIDSEQEQLINELLETLEITELADRFPNEISGGQAQRVALARAFSLNPDLLILDEAFSALDTVVKDKAQRLFIEQWSERPVSTLLITHNLEEAISLSTDLLIMKDGSAYLKENKLAKLSPEKRKDSEDYYEYLESLQKEVNHAWKK